MKKQWISVKCGLSRDPKHRQAMGEGVWLYLHILDITSWDDGIAHDWKDEAAAEDMGMPIRTLREHRRRLAELGYITCNQKQYTQDIVVRNWTNPREYGGKVYNKGGSKTSPQDYIQGDTQGSTEHVTPTYSSKNQTSKKEAAKPKPPTPPEVKLFREVTERFPNKVNYPDVVAIIQGVSKRIGRECTAGDLRPFYAAWCFRDYKKTNLAWLSWAESGTIPPQNGSKPNRMNANLAALQAMDFGD